MKAIAPVALSDVLDGVKRVSATATLEHLAYVSRSTVKKYTTLREAEAGDELPDNILCQI